MLRTLGGCWLAACCGSAAAMRSGRGCGSGAARWFVPGVLALLMFAWLLTRIDAAFAGRAYAAYGGIYIGAALVWARLVEGQPPDRWDLAGAALYLAGAGLILYTRARLMPGDGIALTTEHAAFQPLPSRGGVEGDKQRIRA